MPIVIDSFRGGQSNDRNAGQAGAFWNAKNIDYRSEVASIQLAKRSAVQFQTASIPKAITFWGTGGSIANDMVVFTNAGVFTSAGQQSVLTGIYNVATANNKKYIIRSSSIYEYTNPFTNASVGTYTGDSSEIRPALDFGGDLIIGNGNHIVRFNIDGTVQQWSAGTTDPVIGGLDGTIMALTAVGQWIYVWCDNGYKTTVYQWDGVSSEWSTFIPYVDKSVKNAALLGNTHYWWQSKSDGAIKEVLIGTSYQPQVYVKSQYPELPLSSNADNDKNKMAITAGNSAYINAIETIGDIVYLPGIGRIFGFGAYYPGDKPSFNTEYTFDGTFVTAMSSGGITGSGADAGGFLAFSVLNGSNYDISLINLGQDNATPSYGYCDEGEIETMEYLAPSIIKGEQDVKLVIATYIPDASCSIEIYESRDRGAYSITKTLNYTNNPGHKVTEIKSEGEWRSKQFKFKLITSDGTYSPKIKVGFTNVTKDTGRT